MNGMSRCCVPAFNKIRCISVDFKLHGVVSPNDTHLMSDYFNC
jgi:hypothetical protein